MTTALYMILHKISFKKSFICYTQHLFSSLSAGPENVPVAHLAFSACLSSSSGALSHCHCLFPSQQNSTALQYLRTMSQVLTHLTLPSIVSSFYSLFFFFFFKTQRKINLPQFPQQIYPEPGLECRQLAPDRTMFLPGYTASQPAHTTLYTQTNSSSCLDSKWRQACVFNNFKSPNATTHQALKMSDD